MLKEFILSKFKQNEKKYEDISEKINEMNTDECLELIQQSKRHLKYLENKDGYAFTGLNIGFYFNKSKTNIPDNESLEEIDPYLEAILKEVAIDYCKTVVNKASERLKEIL